MAAKDLDEARKDAAIETRGLRKVYAGTKTTAPKEALKRIDLTVPRGAIFGLLGPNGAGKSTFINILAGLVIKTAGSVRIWGFDQDANPRMSRASIGIVPQELNIDPFMTPAEALDVQAGLCGVPKDARRTSELLEAVGLADKAHAYARSLSGGMRRRLLVAKAMAHDPPILVLDEPTAGVDIDLRRQLWAYVRDLNARGATIILTTHYLEEAQEMCDEIAIINHGEVVAQAPTPELLATIERKTLVLRGSGLARAAAALAATGEIMTALRDDGALTATFRPSRRSTPDVLAAAAAAGAVIVDFSTEEPSLEDVFIALTRDADGSTTTAA